MTHLNHLCNGIMSHIWEEHYINFVIVTNCDMKYMKITPIEITKLKLKFEFICCYIIRDLNIFKFVVLIVMPLMLIMVFWVVVL
jgi:hypothetical protein